MSAYDSHCRHPSAFSKASAAHKDIHLKYPAYRCRFQECLSFLQNFLETTATHIKYVPALSLQPSDNGRNRRHHASRRSHQKTEFLNLLFLSQRQQTQQPFEARRISQAGHNLQGVPLFLYDSTLLQSFRHIFPQVLCRTAENKAPYKEAYSNPGKHFPGYQMHKNERRRPPHNTARLLSPVKSLPATPHHRTPHQSQSGRQLFQKRTGLSLPQQCKQAAARTPPYFLKIFLMHRLPSYPFCPQPLALWKSRLFFYCQVCNPPDLCKLSSSIAPQLIFSK